MAFVAKKSGVFRRQNTISVKKTPKNVNTRTGSEDEKMNNEKTKDDAYQLFIRHNLISKAKRRFIFFKPKDIIVSEPYEINLLITNKGNKTFPGGKTKDF